MLIDSMIAIFAVGCENGDFYIETGDADSQIVTDVEKNGVFVVLSFGLNDTPVKPKREAD